MKGIVLLDIPDELMEGFVQWLRDFDAKHPGCTIEVFAETAHNRADLMRIFAGIKPGFPFLKAFGPKGGDHE